MRTDLRVNPLIVFWLSLCCTSAFGQGSLTPTNIDDESDRLHRTANELCEQEKFEDAIQILNNIITIRPAWAIAHNQLCACHTIISAHHYRGYSYLSRGKKRRAAQEIELAVKLQSEYAESRYLLGLTSLSLGRRDEALEQFKELRTLDPELAKKLCQVSYQDKLIDVKQAKRLP